MPSSGELNGILRVCSGGPPAGAGSAEAIVEDMVRTDEEQWDQRLTQQDVQQVRHLSPLHVTPDLRHNGRCSG